MRPAETKFIDQVHKLARDRHSPFGAKAYELCKGQGLELGAVNCPFDVDADMVYMDQVDTAELLARHADDANVEDVVPVSLISKNLDYDFLAPGSFDFVVASHMLEHTANPGRTISQLARVIRPGGILYFVVPHKDYCFDGLRPTTSLSRLGWKFYADVRKITLEEYCDFMFAFRDMAQVDMHTAEGIFAEAQRWFEGQIDFHVHTFTQDSFWAFLEWLAPRIGCEVVHRQWEGDLHIHAALRKLEPSRLQ